VESAAAVIESRAAGSSNEQYVNFYSGVARADRGPFVLSPKNGCTIKGATAIRTIETAQTA